MQLGSDLEYKFRWVIDNCWVNSNVSKMTLLFIFNNLNYLKFLQEPIFLPYNVKFLNKKLLKRKKFLTDR